MNYLLINTANEELVIVLSKSGTIFACNERQVKKHNEVLLPKLQEVLTQANLTLQDIDEFGVVVGPGSFTGLRVGIATIKAFKDVFNKPVRAINNLDLLYQIAKENYNIVAIEGSLNSYFVGKYENNRLNIYERNLTATELNDITGGKKVAMYNNSHAFELGEVVEFSNEAFVEAFLNSTSYDLTPVYYQLSQAENDKINHANLIIREAEVYDIKAILELYKNSFNEYPLNLLEQKLLAKGYVTYVAQIDEQLVGFVVADNAGAKYDIGIRLIVVDINFRNHGIGTKLITTIENLAREHKSQVSMHIMEHHFTIKTLCEKLGYQVNEIKFDKDLIEKYNIDINDEYKYIIIKSFK
ncbi:MAG: tRNA (adenosine(37)-N6)-threonylcarbamoyltransferase complex dimerization subunit type 1 TsaB [Clostridia bacterium]|nr:tRNA (adenosine(37)-N6)-threonylcarbamoyltransferase complex dimerization subunit type 1 TsaB [Clostridia bacterium]